jgi:hypothetical protein
MSTDVLSDVLSLMALGQPSEDAAPSSSQHQVSWKLRASPQTGHTVIGRRFMIAFCNMWSSPGGKQVTHPSPVLGFYLQISDVLLELRPSMAYSSARLRPGSPCMPQIRILDLPLRLKSAFVIRKDRNVGGLTGVCWR